MVIKMKNIIKRITNNFLLMYIIINILYILIGSILRTYKIIEYSIFSYGYIALLIINILIIVILFFKKKYIKNKIDIFLLLIILFACLSTIFAYNPMKALFGEWMRYEGLFTICYYISTLFLTSFIKKEDRKIVVYFILIFGFIQCIFGICQKLNLFNVPTRIVNNSRWAAGFTNNRNFYCTIMLICISYSIGLYIESKDKLKMTIYLILSYIYAIGLLISKARSCMLGLIFIMIILFIYSLKNKYIKKYIVLFLTIVFSFVLMQLVNLTPVIDYFNKTTSEVSEIVKGNTSSSLGTRRIGLWKETIKLVPKYIVHGVGIDNFANIKDGNAIRSEKGYFDKAHNEYLQILATMGIFSLISYLCVHFIIIKNGIKTTFKNKEIYYLLPVIGYLIQAQFNISTIVVAPIFYIALGLLVDRNSGE